MRVVEVYKAVCCEAGRVWIFPMASACNGGASGYGAGEALGCPTLLPEGFSATFRADRCVKRLT